MLAAWYIHVIIFTALLFHSCLASNAISGTFPSQISELTNLEFLYSLELNANKKRRRLVALLVEEIMAHLLLHSISRVLSAGSAATRITYFADFSLSVCSTCLVQLSY